ncbi:MAG TPA: MurR/RpiR family transcriptional regulator [Clostridiaceae bacterium]|nr:MurR/RpiR family transcriptional regulator [Clostridiaceae bacterium]
MNFFDLDQEKLTRLSNMERELFNYTLRNMHLVKEMTIRQFAKVNYVSTATVLRYVSKLGYENWNNFKVSISGSEITSYEPLIPDVVHESSYYNSYLKNIIEAIKVLTIDSDKLEHFDQIMSRYPRIFLLSQGFSREVASYVCHLLKAIGYDAEQIEHDYELYSLMRRIKREDMILVLSYSGNNTIIVSYMEKILSVAMPTIVSITRSDNNVIQNLSDLNFYIFADEINIHGNDVTSRCSMIAVLEVLLYKHITRLKYDYEHISFNKSLQPNFDPEDVSKTSIDKLRMNRKDKKISDLLET